MKSAQERAQIPLQIDSKLLFGRITVNLAGTPRISDLGCCLSISSIVRAAGAVDSAAAGPARPADCALS